MIKKKLVIVGNPAYVNRMYKHLRKEHPSTRSKMKMMKGGLK
jgi:hypothetical protein